MDDGYALRTADEPAFTDIINAYKKGDPLPSYASEWF